MTKESEGVVDGKYRNGGAEVRDRCVKELDIFTPDEI